MKRWFMDKTKTDMELQEDNERHLANALEKLEKKSQVFTNAQIEIAKKATQALIKAIP